MSKSKVIQSCLTLCNPMDSPWNSSGLNTRVGSLSFLQETVPTQGLNLGLPHCRQILYQQSQKGSPKILEWVAYPFSSRSSWPRNWIRVSCIAGGFFTSWATRKVDCHSSSQISVEITVIPRWMPKQKRHSFNSWLSVVAQPWKGKPSKSG